MSNNGDSDTSVMASSSHQDPIQSGRLVNRRYFQIPKDQSELLEREDAWSDSLCSGPRGMLNVPDHVLQDVKSFHVRKHANLATQDSTTADIGKASIKEAATTVTSKLREPVSSPPPEDNDDRDDEGTPVSSWSESGVDEDEDLVRESLEEPVEEQANTVDASKPPGTPSYNDSRLQAPAAVPPSSIANSDDLEIEVPGYLSQEIDYPVNREALRAVASTRPEPTPPSAQIPIATVASTIQPTTANKKRRTSHIPDDRYGHAHQNAAIVAPEPSKWGSAAPDAHQRSPTTTASSLMPPSVPQALSEKVSESRPSPVMAGPVASKTKSSNLTATWEGRRQTSGSPHLIKPRILEPASVVEYPKFDMTGNGPPNAQRAQRETPNLTPYDEFKATYPDYPETAIKFISGCLNVKQVMRDRTLPEFLYDDFVRAFSTDYMLYISECNRKKAKKILPAVEWYNETTKDAQYTKKVVRRDNLAAIFEAHADDVHTIRRSLGDSQSTSSDSVVSDSDEEMLDASVEGDQEDEEIEESDLEDAHNREPSPELHIESPRSITTPKTSERSRSDPRARREEPPGTIGAASESGVRMQEDPVEKRGRPTKVLPARATQLRSSPGPHLKSPSGKIADVRSRADDSRPKAHATPTNRETPNHLQHSVTPSSGSISTISPLQHLRPRPSSSREGLNTVDETKSQNGERGQKAPISSSAEADKAKKRPLSVDEADDEEEDAFDPPVKEPMPPPPKRPARPKPGSPSNPSSTPAARKSFPSTMPTSVSRPTFTTRSLETTGTGQASSRPKTVAGLAVERGRSTSLSERSSSNAPRGKKRMSEAPEERTKSFREFLKKRRSAGTPSATPVSKQ